METLPIVDVKPGDMYGFVASFSFSSSASWSLFAFALRFWNQIFTCVSVKFNDAENSALSAMDRYCFWRNFRSSARSCEVVKGVRGLRFALCLRSWHFDGLSLERIPIPINNTKRLSAFRYTHKNIRYSKRIVSSFSKGMAHAVQVSTVYTRLWSKDNWNNYS